MPKFYLDTEEKRKGYIVGWRGRDQQNNAKGGPARSPDPSGLQIPTGITLTEV